VDLAGRVAGATGGMGQVIARELAGAGAHVVIVARDLKQAATLRENVTRDSGPGRLQVMSGDLSAGEGVTCVARRILAEHRAVHLLVNNAGAHFNDHRRSADGLEMHIAVDYLAAYGMTVLLKDALRRGGARVVNVASDSRRDTRRVKLPGRPRPATLDLSALDDLARLNPVEGFVPFQAYARAKLLTVMAGYDLARELAPDGVTVNAVHPGIVATGIIDDLIPAVLRPLSGLIRRSMLTPEQGPQQLCAWPPTPCSLQ